MLTPTDNTPPIDTPLWRPSASRIKASQLMQFQQGLGMPDLSYSAFHEWSVLQPGLFWNAVWDYAGIIGSKGVDDSSSPRVLIHSTKMPGAQFFPDARVNFAENLLRDQADGIALISRLETGRRRQISHAELRQQVASLANALCALGIEPGDRVAALLPNIIETVVIMLATTSLGAVFTSCSPDFGENGVFDRFSQTTPKILFAADGYFYNGRTIDSRAIAVALGERIDAIQQVIMIKVIGQDSVDFPLPENCQDYETVLQDFATTRLTFNRVGFNDPLYILYSSGTTGTPKCIVHGVGGTLLQHMKEHKLHVDLRPGDRLFYYTTCGWMMWNWLISGLASGATLVLYDGSPTAPSVTSLWELAEEEEISVFGTSARYLASLEKLNFKPADHYALPKLQTILSTGSPLSAESFRYVYRDIKTDVCLASISGGTDIISCFALGNVCLPVYAGELQCAGLGMDVDVVNEKAEPILGEKGELVCRRPFLAMPTGFWQDPQGEKYHAAYFERFPGLWAQGDYAEKTSHQGFIIHGRSDAVLNPGGVRIGTAEIYRQVERVPQVLDALCVGQQWQGDIRIILFVVLRPGVSLDPTLKQHIATVIRTHATPRHVPAKILQVADIPRTISGKIVELAVRNVIHGLPVTNTDALANPQTLKYFQDLDELKQ